MSEGAERISQRRAKVNIVPILRKGDVTGWDIARPIVADFGLLVVLTPLLIVPIR